MAETQTLGGARARRSAGSRARLLDVPRLVSAVSIAEPVRVHGRVTESTGLVVRARCPGARIGDLFEVVRHSSVAAASTPLPAEVVGFRGEEVFLMMLGDAEGIGPGSEIRPTGRRLEVPTGDQLLGRVLDGLGRPIDDGPPIDLRATRPAMSSPPDPLRRPRVTSPFRTGVRSMDGFLTVGEGQRVGIFAAAGVGKSTLLGMLARNTEAEVNVIALIGERGREVRDFLEESLGEEGLRRSVVIVATSDQPSLVRLKAAHVATAVAESFRDRGKKVLLLMDSVTRFARAQREVGLAVGEPPARSGFPPSVFATLPRLLERTGNSEHGSITAFYTVLVEGDDMTEPVADEVRSILDGHVVLRRELAARGHFPAIDVLESVSRVMAQVSDETHRTCAAAVRELLAAWERSRDLILLGAYQRGSDTVTDRALDLLPAIEAFLRQEVEEQPSFARAIGALRELAVQAGVELRSAEAMADGVPGLAAIDADPIDAAALEGDHLGATSPQAIEEIGEAAAGPLPVQVAPLTE